MAKVNNASPRKRGFKKVTSIGNPKKKNVRDNSKTGQRLKRGR